jgi:hypothetical protein
MKEYTVIWRIQVDGENHRAAAEAALEIMKDPVTALVFDVFEKDSGEFEGCCTVDLWGDEKSKEEIRESQPGVFTTAQPFKSIDAGAVDRDDIRDFLNRTVAHPEIAPEDIHLYFMSLSYLKGQVEPQEVNRVALLFREDALRYCNHGFLTRETINKCAISEPDTAAGYCAADMIDEETLSDWKLNSPDTYRNFAVAPRTVCPKCERKGFAYESAAETYFCNNCFYILPAGEAEKSD